MLFTYYVPDTVLGTRDTAAKEGKAYHSSKTKQATVFRNIWLYGLKPLLEGKSCDANSAFVSRWNMDFKNKQKQVNSEGKRRQGDFAKKNVFSMRGLKWIKSSSPCTLSHKLGNSLPATESIVRNCISFIPMDSAVFPATDLPQDLSTCWWNVLLPDTCTAPSFT